MRSGLKELEALGYIIRARRQDERGRFTGWEILVFETLEDAADYVSRQQMENSNGNRTTTPSSQVQQSRKRENRQSALPSSDNLQQIINQKQLIHDLTNTPLTPQGEPGESEMEVSMSVKVTQDTHGFSGQESLSDRQTCEDFERLERTQLLQELSNLTRKSFESLRLNTRLANALNRYPIHVKDALEYFQQALATWKNKPGLGLFISAVKSGQKPCPTKPGRGWREWVDEAIRRGWMLYSQAWNGDILIHFVNGVQQLWSQLHSLSWSEVEQLAFGKHLEPIAAAQRS
ncbi:hypothetical protein [Chroococcidiopsis thermalis]|uniref:hypothetical protein n=1 Tax=Chroococcidiopsis thermalis TaxID=54299 RepID=UPI0002E9EE29|nr:hypothetical protein [Chroococcidiopsis thermalis]PSB45028.1 hypothetical protein C7B80_18470 [Cyanosarcina cf. burmensis CCALA 770]